MVEPLVSVIILTLNSEKYIGRCLTSMVLQSYPKERMEILIVDAGSTDKTNEIVERFRDQLNIKCFALIHSSQGEARNLGLQHAEGKYVTFCDSDDFYLRDKIKIQVDTMEQEAIEVTYFDVLRFEESDQIKFFVYHQKVQNQDLLSQCILGIVINLNTIMVKKCFIEERHILFPIGEAGRYAEDWNFIFQLTMRRAVFKKIFSSLAVYHQRSDSSTQWDIQWKMKYYPLTYLKLVKDQLDDQYQQYLVSKMKQWYFKLAISLIIVGNYDEAKLIFKEKTYPILSKVVNGLFFIMQLLPKSCIKQFTIFLWRTWSSINHRTYVRIVPVIQQQLALIQERR